jgi:hypothetical protein
MGAGAVTVTGGGTFEPELTTGEPVVVVTAPGGGAS